MKHMMEFTAEMIAGFLGGDIVGNKDAKVHTVSSIEEGRAGSLAYLTNPKYEPFLYTTGASIVLVDRAFEPSQPVAATLVKVDDAGACVLKLLEMYNAAKPRRKGISGRASVSERAQVGQECYIGDFAVVEEEAVIGEGCQIYPQVYVGRGVRIGDNTTLYPGVKIYEGCIVGANCILHAGAVIGADGFGFMPNAAGGFDKIPQLGNVVIEDDVEIGANTCKPLTGTEYAVSTDSDIFVYDLASGETKNICKPLTGKSECQGEASLDLAEMVGYDKYPVWSPDDSKIAFLSQRRPGNESDKARLFLYDCASGEMQDLTEDFDYNAMNVVWEGNDRLWFIAPIEATHQICRIEPSVGEVEVVTRGDHDINAFTMASGRIAAEMCTISMATEFFDVNPADGTLTQVSAINKPVYDNIRMGEVQKRWVKTTDGQQMLAWVILPPDFDASKKYPVLLYCQGGPQSVVSQFWSYRWNFQLMAAQGYVVVAPNRRGLPSFGQEWLDQISGDYSGQNIRDYLSAIDDVAREPWADRERMGCVGASYGGYSVYFLAGCHEKRFKAFIAHCGIFDFDSMYGETEELFFVNNDFGGPYWDAKNATAQRSYANSPHKFVTKWDTPILIFTGEKDFRIPYTQSLEAFTAARMRGIPARLVEFENEAHQVFKPQNSLVWNREFFGWLDKYVK